MATITITRALAEKKRIKDQLDTIANNSDFIATTKVNRKDEKEVQEFKEQSKANLDKWTSLYKRYINLTKAIYESNQRTQVTIGDKQYTVTEVLAEKEIISKREFLLSRIRNANTNATSVVDKTAEQVEDSVRSSLEAQKFDTEEAMKSFEAVVRANAVNQYEKIKIVGFDVNEYIAKEQERIEAFKLNADYALSESNAITTIEVD